MGIGFHTMYSVFMVAASWSWVCNSVWNTLSYPYLYDTNHYCYRMPSQVMMIMLVFQMR